MNSQRKYQTDRYRNCKYFFQFALYKLVLKMASKRLIISDCNLTKIDIGIWPISSNTSSFLSAFTKIEFIHSMYNHILRKYQIDIFKKSKKRPTHQIYGLISKFWNLISFSSFNFLRILIGLGFD